MRLKTKTSAFLLGLALSGCDTPGPVPPLPRPAPASETDKVVANLITQGAQELERTPKDGKSWQKYGDICLINNWPEEALLAYTYANTLGCDEALMMRAHAQRMLGEPSAVSTAQVFVSLSNDPDAKLTLAQWLMEDGDLDKASHWMNQVGDIDSYRKLATQIHLDIQSGNLTDVLDRISEIPQDQMTPQLHHLAVLAAKASGRDDLVENHARFSEDSPVPPSPRLINLFPLARTKNADFTRATRAMTRMPIGEAIRTLGQLVSERPEEAFIRAAYAEALTKSGDHIGAKKTLDAGLPFPNTEPMIWSVDALVHYRMRGEGTASIQRALTSAQRSVDLRPSKAQSRALLAMCHEYIGNYQEAKMQWSQAAKYETSTKKQVLYTASQYRCLGFSGSKAEAADQLLKLANLHQDSHPEILYDAAVAARNAGWNEVVDEILPRLTETQRKNFLKQ